MACGRCVTSAKTASFILQSVLQTLHPSCTFEHRAARRGSRKFGERIFTTRSVWWDSRAASACRTLAARETSEGRWVWLSAAQVYLRDRSRCRNASNSAGSGTS